MAVLQSQCLLRHGRGSGQRVTLGGQRPQVQSVLGGIPVPHLVVVPGQIGMGETEQMTGPDVLGDGVDGSLALVQPDSRVDSGRHRSAHPSRGACVGKRIPIDRATQHRRNLRTGPRPTTQPIRQLVDRDPHRIAIGNVGLPGGGTVEHGSA